jgi:enediyne biosynthesis protein E4
MTYWQGGKEYPLPQRETMIKQMPGLKKDFVYHRAYGKTTIQDLLSVSALEAAQKLVAKLFATTYFENDKGKLVGRALPLAAQFSACNQVSSGDFNSDGNADLLLVGNSYHSEVESGRYDAGNGTVLLGDGKGGFAWSQNRHNGFWATKEARDMTALKLANGKTLYLVANNNDVVQGFGNW